MVKKISIVIAICALAIPSQAGFKMFAPGQKEPIMYSNETAEEKAANEAKDEYYRKIAEHAEKITPKRTPPKKKKVPRYTKEELLQGKPQQRVDDGPRPGGHRRHIWREKTGFNTPAERTRYRMEIQRLKRKLQKEKSKPNPAGATPREIRKELGR